MSDNPILVLGGTGKTGRRVVTQLRHRGLTVRVASRSGQQRFDWHDEATWAPAVDGVASVCVATASVAPPLRAFGELAAACGVRRLVLLSARAWEAAGDEDLLASEHAVRDFDGVWTILRPTWFAQNFSEEPFLRAMVMDSEVRLSTGGGLVPFIDAWDIAAVAAAVLTEDGHAARTYELSGPRLLTFDTATREVAQASGRDIQYIPVSAQEFAGHLGARGFPVGFAAFLNLLFDWVDQGQEAHLSDGVQRVLGREPRDFTDYVRRAAAAGAWDA